MKTYARIEAGVVAELTTTDQDITEIYHPDLDWVDCTGASGVAVGWTWSGAAFAAPGPVALAPAEVAASARALLAASDVTVIRCVEHAVAIPAAWAAYRAALRAIADSGVLPSGGLPARPDYPAGT